MPWWGLVGLGAIGLVVGSLTPLVIEKAPELESGSRTRVTLAERTFAAMLTGLLFGSIGWRIEQTWALPAFLVLVAGLVVLSGIDLRSHRLPRRWVYGTAVLAMPWLVLSAVVDGQASRLWDALLGGGIALTAFWLLYMAARGGFGDGDVRLAPLLGVHLGWLHLGLVPVGLFLGFVLGSIVGVTMMVMGRAGRRTALPFGPFMAAGALIAILVGEQVLDLWPTV